MHASATSTQKALTAVLALVFPLLLASLAIFSALGDALPSLVQLFALVLLAAALAYSFSRIATEVWLTDDATVFFKSLRAMLIKSTAGMLSALNST
jgi:hypothetical protein